MLLPWPLLAPRRCGRQCAGGAGRPWPHPLPDPLPWGQASARGACCRLVGILVSCACTKFSPQRQRLHTQLTTALIAAHLEGTALKGRNPSGAVGSSCATAAPVPPVPRPSRPICLLPLRWRHRCSGVYALYTYKGLPASSPSGSPQPMQAAAAGPGTAAGGPGGTGPNLTRGPSATRLAYRLELPVPGRVSDVTSASRRTWPTAWCSGMQALARAMF